jgi:hypothetical protein
VANNKENLAQWLLIRALLKSDKAAEINSIADKMVKELETNPSESD